MLWGGIGCVGGGGTGSAYNQEGPKVKGECNSFFEVVSAPLNIKLVNDCLDGGPKWWNKFHNSYSCHVASDHHCLWYLLYVVRVVQISQTSRKVLVYHL